MMLYIIGDRIATSRGHNTLAHQYYEILDGFLRPRRSTIYKLRSFVLPRKRGPAPTPSKGAVATYDLSAWLVVNSARSRIARQRENRDRSHCALITPQWYACIAAILSMDIWLINKSGAFGDSSSNWTNHDLNPQKYSEMRARPEDLIPGYIILRNLRLWKLQPDADSSLMPPCIETRILKGFRTISLNENTPQWGRDRVQRIESLYKIIYRLASALVADLFLTV